MDEFAGPPSSQEQRPWWKPIPESLPEGEFSLYLERDWGVCLNWDTGTDITDGWY